MRGVAGDNADEIGLAALTRVANYPPDPSHGVIRRQYRLGCVIVVARRQAEPVGPRDARFKDCTTATVARPMSPLRPAR